MAHEIDPNLRWCHLLALEDEARELEANAGVVNDPGDLSCYPIEVESGISTYAFPCSRSFLPFTGRDRYDQHGQIGPTYAQQTR